MKHASLSPFKPSFERGEAMSECGQMPTEDPQQRLLLEDRRAQHGGVFGRALPPGSSTGAAVDDMSGAEGLFGCAFHEGLDEARAVGRARGPRDEPPPQLHSVAETACGQGSSSLRRTEMSCERTPAVGESPVDGKTEAAMHVHEYLTGGRAPVLETQPGRATGEADRDQATGEERRAAGEAAELHNTRRRHGFWGSRRRRHPSPSPHLPPTNERPHGGGGVLPKF